MTFQVCMMLAGTPIGWGALIFAFGTATSKVLDKAAVLRKAQCEGRALLICARTVARLANSCPF